MDPFSQYHYIAAATIARLFLGCLFFFQGYDAVFNIGLKQVVATFQASFSGKGIPKPIVALASLFTAYSGLAGGLLLLLGLFQYEALCLLGINMLIAATGFGINTPMWDTKHVFPRIALLLFLLAVPQNWQVMSLDHLFFNN